MYIFKIRFPRFLQTCISHPKINNLNVVLNSEIGVASNTGKLMFALKKMSKFFGVRFPKSLQTCKSHLKVNIVKVSSNSDQNSEVEIAQCMQFTSKDVVFFLSLRLSYSKSYISTYIIIQQWMFLGPSRFKRSCEVFLFVKCIVKFYKKTELN